MVNHAQNMKNKNGLLENREYRKRVKESILKAIELHKKDIKKLRSELKRLKEGKHPYYELRKS